MAEMTPVQKRKFLLICMAGITLTALLCIPAGYVASPPWEVQVVDSHGQRLANVEIEQHWYYYFGAHRKEANTVLKTDESGRITLPERKVWTPRLAVWCGRAFGILNVHSSFGPQATVYASAPGYKRQPSWRDPKMPLSNGVFHSTIVLHRERPT